MGYEMLVILLIAMIGFTFGALVSKEDGSKRYKITTKA